MPQEAEKENKQHDDGVVHSEVGDVGADPSQGVAEVGGEAEGVKAEHDIPWAAGAEAGFDPLSGTRDEFKVRGWSRRGRGRYSTVGCHVCVRSLLSLSPIRGFDSLGIQRVWRGNEEGVMTMLGLCEKGRWRGCIGNRIEMNRREYWGI